VFENASAQEGVYQCGRWTLSWRKIVR